MVRLRGDHNQIIYAHEQVSPGNFTGRCSHLPDDGFMELGKTVSSLSISVTQFEADEIAGVEHPDDLVWPLAWMYSQNLESFSEVMFAESCSFSAQKKSFDDMLQLCNFHVKAVEGF